MRKQEAEKLVNDTFTQAYDEGRFRRFIHELFHDYEKDDKKASSGNYIFAAFKGRILSYKRLAKFTDPAELKLDVLAVKVPCRNTLENARTMQRNFIARYLNGSRGGVLKDAAVVAFYSDDCEDWRFSLVRMDYVLDEEKQKVDKKLTPARRYSFLVGKHEKTHTARKQLLPMLQSDTETTFTELETAFNIETVTKEFFEEYKTLYLSLNQALEKHLEKDSTTKAEFDTKAIKTGDFAKRLLGQIVFLYFLQKKGWLGVAKGENWGSGPKDFLQALYRKEYGEYSNFFNDVLEPLFYEALATERTDNYYDKLNCRIPFLNGGLFEAIHNYDWVNTDILLDNNIFSKSFEVFDLYNFTIREDEPLDKEVAVDPEMLGQVFENLIPENQRKGSGTYYTPREIVHYMCQESLINYLDARLNIESRPIEEHGQQSHIPDLHEANLPTKYEDVYASVVPLEDLAKFIHHGDVAQEHDTTAQIKTQNEHYKGDYQHRIPETVRKYAPQIDDALASVKICDPAIGSGAFPVGVMNEIVRARGSLNAYLGDEDRTPYGLKRHAIQESIYGVDIEPSAVDIAKLRLWLSLVVDEEDFGTIKPLPNLEYKIVSGNSLFGIEESIFNSRQVLDLEKLQKQYFDETRPSEKTKLKNRIESIIDFLEQDGSFSFEIRFSEVFRKHGGFDISIANPPYVFARDGKEKGISSSDKEYFYDHFTLAQYQVNLYPLFIELSTNTLKHNGVLCYITPNNWMTINTNTGLRKFILEQSDITIVNFHAKIFESANVDSSIIIYRKGSVNPYVDLYEYITGFSLVSRQETERFKKDPSMIINMDSLKANSTLPLLEKIESATVPLSTVALVKAGLKAYEVGKGKPAQTKQIKDDRIYHSKTKDDESYIEYLDGRDVCRYYSTWGGKYLKYGDNLAGPRNIGLFDSVRILVRQIPSKLPYCIHACYLDKTVLNNLDSMNIVSIRVNPHYLLAILNSRLVSYWFIYRLGKLQRGIFPQFKINELKRFPVPKSNDEALKNNVADLSQQMCKLMSTGAEDNPKVKSLNSQIDGLIYQLYGLTPEEIAIIEKTVEEGAR